jgi:hypothetical protein
MELEKRVEALEKRTEQVNNVLSEATMTVSNKYGILGKLDSLTDSIDSLNKKVALLTSSYNALMTDEPYIKPFKAEAIQDLYMKTDLTLKEVKEAINQNLPEYKDLSIQTISKFAKGEFPKDNAFEKVRSFLGKYFRNEAFRKANKQIDKA